MKILVTGANGQLGTDILSILYQFGIECIGMGRETLDITKFSEVSTCLHNYKPDVVIHCAAYTNVDKAEIEPELCHLVNAAATANLAKICFAVNACLVYISTDYVFSGKGSEPIDVSTPPDPISVYGRSKLAGEKSIIQVLEKFYIIRTSWAFGLNGNNFVKTMLKLGTIHEEINVVYDQIGSPTYTYDLAKLIIDLINTGRYGLYHATNEGFCSWAEFAAEIFRQTSKNIKVNNISSDAYSDKIIRPLNSRLSKKSLDDAGIDRLPPWQDALARYLKEINVLG